MSWMPKSIAWNSILGMGKILVIVAGTALGRRKNQIPRTKFQVRFGSWILVLGFYFLGGSAHGDDWPQWLGPQRDGIWRETGILEKFPEGGPKVRWRHKIEPGYTGPAVSQGRVYVMAREEG